VWNPGSRARVRAAFLASGSPIAADVFARVDGQLTRRLGDWAAAHTEACQATRVRGEQSESMLDLRMQCLARARRQIASLVDVWTVEPVNLEKAIDAAASAGDVATCADTEALAMPVAPPRDPALARQIDQVRGMLDRAQAHQRAGQLEAGLALARRAVTAARPLAYAPVLAEALFHNGNLECQAGSKVAGVPILYQAMQRSAEARDDVLSARILNTLVVQLSNDKRLAEAESVAAFAAAATERAGNRDELVAHRLSGLGSLTYAQGKYEESLRHHREARVIQARRLGEGRALVVQLDHGVATNLRMLGRLAEAEVLLRRTLAVQERTLGAVHHTVAMTLNNLMGVLAERGALAEARQLCERALAIREQVYPPGHPMTASSVHNLAWLSAAQGRTDEARALYVRAEQMRSAALGADHPDTTKTRLDLAGLAIEDGDTATGRRLVDRVIAARESAAGLHHPSVAVALTYRGDALAREGNWKAAEAAVSRSLAIWDGQAGTPPERADALLVLGKVRLGQKRPAEAVALIERARVLDEKVRGEDSPYHDDILAALGEAYLAAGRADDAVRVLESAAALAEKLGGRTPSPAVIRFHLARALWTSGKRARALEVARAARDAMSDRDGALRASAARWLRVHDRTARPERR
jgi:tetratricopeptide (TPR) repeat protein